MSVGKSSSFELFSRERKVQFKIGNKSKLEKDENDWDEWKVITRIKVKRRR